MPNKSKRTRNHAGEAQIVRINRRIAKHCQKNGHPLEKVKKLRPTKYETLGHLRSDGEFVAIDVATGKILGRTYDLSQWERITDKYVRPWNLKSTTVRKFVSKFPANSPNSGWTDYEPAPVKIIYHREDDQTNE